MKKLITGLALLNSMSLFAASSTTGMNGPAPACISNMGTKTEELLNALFKDKYKTLPADTKRSNCNIHVDSTNYGKTKVTIYGNVDVSSKGKLTETLRNTNVSFEIDENNEVVSYCVTEGSKYDPVPGTYATAAELILNGSRTNKNAYIRIYKTGRINIFTSEFGFKYSIICN